MKPTIWNAMFIIVILIAIGFAVVLFRLESPYLQENQELSQYVQELSEDKSQLEDTIWSMEEQRDRTLRQIITHIQESTDQVLEINRLQDELRKANEGRDTWPCGTLKEPNVVIDVVPTLPELVEEVIDGVVHIKTSEINQRGQKTIYESTGFVIGPRLIKTARHVVNDVVDFTIITNDGHVLKATRAISHKNHDTGYIYIDDLTCVGNCSVKNGRALNVLRGEHEVRLKVLELGSIKDCKLGQDVFVIGASFGQRHFPNVTKGIVSSLDLDLGRYEPDPLPYGRLSVEEIGWTVSWASDAATYGGNSGSPVFTMDGKVVGVLVGGIGDFESISYCIPVDVFTHDIEAVILMFVQDKYQIEEIPDYRFDEMYGWYQWQKNDKRLDEVYYWYLEVKEGLEKLLKSLSVVTVYEK